MVELYTNLRRLLIVYSHIKKSNPIFLKRLLLALYFKFLQPSFLNEDSMANGQEHTSRYIHPSILSFHYFHRFCSSNLLKRECNTNPGMNSTNIGMNLIHIWTNFFWTNFFFNFRSVYSVFKLFGNSLF